MCDYKTENHAFPFVILTASLRCFPLLLSTKLGYTCKIVLFQISVQCGNLESFLLIWLWIGQVESKETKPQAAIQNQPYFVVILLAPYGDVIHRHPVFP